MALSYRTSSTTAGGTANAISLGGRPSSGGVGKTTFWDNITTAQNDTGHTDYRCMFIYNSGTSVVNNVTVTPSNKGGGSTVTVAASSVATNTFANYVTGVMGTETNTPTQITGTWASSVNVGTLNPGEVKAVWFRRVTAAKTAAVTEDTCAFVIAGQEVIA